MVGKIFGDRGSLSLFDGPKLVVDWLFTEVLNFANILWSQFAWIGVLLITLPLLRRIVDIFRRLLGG